MNIRKIKIILNCKKDNQYRNLRRFFMITGHPVDLFF